MGYASELSSKTGALPDSFPMVISFFFFFFFLFPVLEHDSIIVFLYVKV
jgi:hypothetical protein